VSFDELGGLTRAREGRGGGGVVKSIVRLMLGHDCPPQRRGRGYNEATVILLGHCPYVMRFEHGTETG
jgi:hypothetical protein